MTTKNKTMEKGLLFLICIVYILALALNTIGVPQGANILSNTTESAPTVTPSSRADDGGTITVLTLDTTQQDNAWKAYVGNVSGRLTLDDANGNTIYDWNIVATDIEGEVYVTRNDSVVWSNITCALQAVINTEQTLLSMNSSDSDSINSTFNATVHAQMQVGVNTLSQSNCRSTSTYINDTRQSLTVNSTFQEILLQDENSALIYATFIEQDESSYKAGSQVNVTYDFQLIVAEDDSSPTPTTYYFYLEIS